MDTDDSVDDPDDLVAQLEHSDRLITELMNRFDAREAELARYWLADAMGDGAA